MSSNEDVRVTPQGGILEGSNPTVWDSKNPITLFVIQATIIIVLTHLLHWPLSFIRQPRVIAEVVGGILLGPSVLGRIPKFTETIFPKESLAGLNLASTLGLVLFLFIIGLETDLRSLMGNWRVAVSVSTASMILPFGLGCAISYGLYREFHDEPGLVSINFPTYMLFVGIAMAITAFPVLCRILTELKLLGTNVGVIVLSAGVGNDVAGWVLLALCVALVNAGTGISALWVLLVTLGFILFLVYAVRPVFLWYLRKTGSLERGPSQAVVVVTLLLVLASAFFTQVIGVHAIFGGFVVGLICPHEGGFAIKLTEKIEDLVTAIFLPLYFALSGLQTNLGALDSGVVWGYVVGVIAIAFFAKVIAGALASKAAGLLWRESMAVGVLMSCKGLVELIVLNIGRQAKILSERTFTIFVVMALVTTFLTTPLTTWLYPQWYQDKTARWRRGEIDWDGNSLQSDSGAPSTPAEKLRAKPVRRIAVYLRLDGLSSVCTFVSLLGGNRASKSTALVHHANKESEPRSEPSEEQLDIRDSHTESAIAAHGLRLIELTDRLSSTMKVSAIEEYSVWDPVVNVFRSFGQLNSIQSEGRVAVVPKHLYADSVLDMTRDASADFLLLPWSASGSVSDRQSLWSTEESPASPSNAPYANFVSQVIARVSVNTGILVDRALEIPSGERPNLKRTTSARSVPIVHNHMFSNSKQHIVLLFYGGADDRFALRLALQLAQNEQVTATIVHVKTPTTATSTQTNAESSSAPSSSGDNRRTAEQAHVFLPDESDSAFFAALRDSVPTELSSRVVFTEANLPDHSAAVTDFAVHTVQEEIDRSGTESNHLVIVGRRSVGGDSSPSEGETGSETRKALGIVGEALVRRSIRANVLVLQAAEL